MMPALPARPRVDEALHALEAALRHARGEPAGATVVHDARAEAPRAPEAAIEVASLLARVQEELLVANLGIGAADSWRVDPLPPAALAGSFPTDAVQLPRAMQAGTQAPQKESYTARELMALHDEAFVRASYRAILKREPDPQGLAFFTEALTEGRMSRTDLLSQLRRSIEGSAARAKVPGLRGLFARERLARFPVIGYLYRAVQALARLPYLAVRLDLMEHRDNQLARSINQIGGLTEAVLSEMRQRQAHLANMANQLVERVNALQAADAERKTNVRGLARHVARLDDSIAAVRAVADACAAKSELQTIGEAARAALAALRESVEAAHAELADTRGQALRAEGAVEALRSEVRAFEEQARAHMRDVGTSLGNAGIQIADVTSGLHGFAAETRGQFQKVQADLARARQPDAEVAHLQQSLSNAGIQIADITSGLHGFAAETRGQLRSLGEAVNDQQRRLGKLMQDLASAAGLPADDGRRQALEGHRARILDAFYVELERRFRGERFEIKRRLEVYVPVIRGSEALSRKAPVLDVGCGRGELLEVLRDNAVPASGIDINAIQVDECKAMGLAAVEGDALRHLRALKDGALGAVTGMHIVEHFAFADLVALLDETFRVLKRGGVAIFETPNPENLIVGACTFWLDPTHVRPLPPELLRFLAEARGFAPVEVMRLHPFPESEQLPGGEAMAQLNRLLYGARDYAIVARKP